MATLKIDTSQATANVQQLNAALEKTEKTATDVNKQGDALGDTFENVGKAAENMSGGINAADQVLDALGQTAGNTNTIAGQAIKTVIPQLKAGLNGASLSFRTLGKAIAATGVGLLVQAVSYLIANFKTVTTWVKNFGKAAQSSMPGVAKVINNVANAFSNIRNRIREIITNFGSTAFGRWLGLDKAAEKFQAIKDAADQATAATKAQMEALEEVDAKSGGKASGGVTRNTADPLGTVDGGLLAQRSAMAASAVSATKQQAEEIETVTAAYEKQESILEMIENAFQRMNSEGIKLSATQKANAISIMNSVASVSGSIAGAVEESSAAYKALMTVQVIATTAVGAMTAFTAMDNLTMVQKWASFGAILAAGAAQLVALYSNKIESAGPATQKAVAPTLSAPAPTGSVAAAQIANADGQQVYITEQQLKDNSANQVQLKQNTVF